MGLFDGFGMTGGGGSGSPSGSMYGPGGAFSQTFRGGSGGLGGLASFGGPVGSARQGGIAFGNRGTGAITGDISDIRQGIMGKDTDMLAFVREQQKMREESLTRLSEQARIAREQDMARGRARGEQMFGSPAIETSRQERSTDIADILAARRGQVGGFSAEENSALRSQMLQQLGQSETTQMRGLRGQQATQGIRGGMAAAQQQQQLAANQNARAQMERDLFIQNIAQQQQALGGYEQAVRAAEQEEIGRYGQRQVGILGTEMGYGQLGAADRASLTQQLMGQSEAEIGAVREKKNFLGQPGGKK